MCRFEINGNVKWPPEFSAEQKDFFDSRDALLFHQSIPGYAPTPLLKLDGLAGDLGIGSIYVKDESKRFDVKAFKPLGASYAIYQVIRRKIFDKTGDYPDVDIFSKSGLLKSLDKITFCAATDGNHGRAVAWAANKLGQNAVIFMPAAASPRRIANIKNEGARVELVKGPFDDCVKICESKARENGWQVISDTAYEGNMELPRFIIQGYKTIFLEIGEQIKLEDLPLFDLVVLPAGVGGLAAAGAGYYAHKYGITRPAALCVEPDDADCFYLSIKAGMASQSPGKQESIMVGLACGFPSLAAWPICRDNIDAFTAIGDGWAKKAMRTYKKFGITSGESGSAGLAGLLALLQSEKLAGLKNFYHLGKESRILILNTEGDTDPVSYKEITGEADD